MTNAVGTAGDDTRPMADRPPRAARRRARRPGGRGARSGGLGSLAALVAGSALTGRGGRALGLPLLALAAGGPAVVPELRYRRWRWEVRERRDRPPARDRWRAPAR